METICIIDNLSEVRRTLLCFSHLFLLVSNQHDPIDPDVLGSISYMFNDMIDKLEEMEKELEIKIS